MHEVDAQAIGSLIALLAATGQIEILSANFNSSSPVDAQIVLLSLDGGEITIPLAGITFKSHAESKR